MDIKKLLMQAFELPTTLEDAILYAKSSPVISSSVNDIAFKQTVLNILILAGLVSENDFSASQEHFKEQLFKEFGKELLAAAYELSEEDQEEDEPDDEQLEDDVCAKSEQKLPQA